MADDGVYTSEKPLVVLLKSRGQSLEPDESSMKPGSYWEIPFLGGTSFVFAEISTTRHRAADVLHLARGDPDQA